jgi:hypothetical protein
VNSVALVSAKYLGQQETAAGDRQMSGQEPCNVVQGLSKVYTSAASTAAAVSKVAAGHQRNFALPKPLRSGGVGHVCEHSQLCSSTQLPHLCLFVCSLTCQALQ